jgi:hypothetical protein
MPRRFPDQASYDEALTAAVVEALLPEVRRRLEAGQRADGREAATVGDKVERFLDERTRRPKRR